MLLTSLFPPHPKRRCGLVLGAARERVRVALRLAELPKVTVAFSVGELSYSKVRSITRFATEANEETLVELARCMTASHVERTVRLYRLVNQGIDEATDEAQPVDPYRDRFLSTRWNDDGTLSIRAKLPPAECAMVMEALQRASDALFRDRNRNHPAEATDAEDVPGGTPEHRYRYRDTENVPAGTPDAELRSNRSSRLDVPDGAVINVSRKAPSVPAPLARAIKARDGCCTFPACTRQSFVDIHHIVRRANSGENTLANCALLCRTHHRMLHEGGYTMVSPTCGRFEFHRPDGTLIQSAPTTVAAGDDALSALNADRGVFPTEDTPVPDWDGDHPNYPLVIDFLLDADGRLRDDNPSSNN